MLSRIDKLLSIFGLKQEIFPQAAAPYPLNERCPVDFIWQQSPYLVCCFNNCTASGNDNPACSGNQFQYNLVYPGEEAYAVAAGELAASSRASCRFLPRWGARKSLVDQ